MNEQIKELEKQAFDAVWNLYNYPIGPGTHFRPDGFEEKFAELIVRECCSKLKEMGEGWHEFAENPPQGQAHNASGALFAAFRLKEDAVDEIKEHFGVEE